MNEAGDDAIGQNSRESSRENASRSIADAKRLARRALLAVYRCAPSALAPARNAPLARPHSRRDSRPRPPRPLHYLPDAAAKLQPTSAAVRVRTRYLLQQLAFRVQAHYRLSGPAARLAEGDPTAQAQILQGAVKQLKGKLWKKARQLPQFHERTVWVDDLQLKYANRAGDTRSIDLAQVETMTVVRADRWEFALHTRSGREYVFRAGSKEAYAAWWEGLRSTTRWRARTTHRSF